MGSGEQPLLPPELRSPQAKNQQQNCQHMFCSHQMMFNLGHDDFSKISFNINFVLYGLTDGAQKPRSRMVTQYFITRWWGDGLHVSEWHGWEVIKKYKENKVNTYFSGEKSSLGTVGAVNVVIF